VVIAGAGFAAAVAAVAGVVEAGAFASSFLQDAQARAATINSIHRVDMAGLPDGGTSLFAAPVGRLSKTTDGDQQNY
jgi:hypothetical protein